MKQSMATLIKIQKEEKESYDYHYGRYYGCYYYYGFIIDLSSDSTYIIKQSGPASWPIEYIKFINVQ